MSTYYIKLHQHDFANFLTCDFKYHISHNMGYVPKVMKKTLNIGDLFAKGVEILHKGNPITRPGNWVDPLPQAMLLVHKQQETLLNSATNQAQIDDINTDTSTVQAMLYGYQKKFLDINKYNTQPEHRIEWMLRVLGVTIVYVCRLDGRLLDIARRPWILEIKTSSGTNEGLILELPTNFQINSYWLANYRANKEQALGIVYRFAIKPTIRQTQKENAEQFQKRVIGEYEKNTAKYFHEEVLQVDLNAIKRFEKDLMTHFENLVLAHVKNKWPRRGNACMERYGSLCPYIRYCGNPTEETLETYYKKQEVCE